MGMTFQNLLSKTKNSTGHLYEEFTLFAFIVHDKSRNIDFHHHLNVMFDKFDYSTGSRLLFVALAEPEENEMGFRPIMRRFTSQSRKKIIEKFRLADFHNETDFVEELFQWISVPPNELPVIVVTGQFFHDSITIKTNKRYLEMQLSTLGYLADRIPPNSWNISEIIKNHFYRNNIPGIDRLNQRQDDYSIELKPEERKIIYNRVNFPPAEIILEPKEFAFYVYFVQRIFRELDYIHFNQDSKDYDNEVSSFIKELNNIYEKLYERSPREIDKFNFLPNFITTKSRINGKIYNALGGENPDSDYMIIKDTGPRGATKYYLALEKNAVTTSSSILVSLLEN